MSILDPVELPPHPPAWTVTTYCPDCVRRATRCTWTEDADGLWQTACGHAHEFTTDGPKANGYAYCPFCGAALKEGS